MLRNERGSTIFLGTQLGVLRPCNINEFTFINYHDPHESGACRAQ